MTHHTLTLADTVTVTDTKRFNMSVKLADTVAPIDTLHLSGYISVFDALDPLYINFNIGIGEDFSYTFTFDDYSFVNISADTASTHFAKSFLYATAEEMTSVVGANGITISLTSAETTLMDAARYQYSGFLIKGTKKYKVIGGILSFYSMFDI
jgi:hypothetical protein